MHLVNVSNRLHSHLPPLFPLFQTCHCSLKEIKLVVGLCAVCTSIYYAWNLLILPLTFLLSLYQKHKMCLEQSEQSFTLNQNPLD